ncbi:hypothetical protein P0082_12280 [Candidatus Haliotispira prima]|uniref:Tetratricopeptide repeat protein n=1 Tax=Candidatus Haliotispira prima TaxID=3034016 RepID=A0ABY8MI48_9SPIO|nr:hypothetical protein P0082_12280 [Candidatus Haliotispira prima]
MAEFSERSIRMELIYIELDRQVVAERFGKSGETGEEPDLVSGKLPFDPEIPLPYILRQDSNRSLEQHGTEDSETASSLDWNSVVDGILYVVLYEPKHEYGNYYRDFLLTLEPELPHILQDRLRDQYEEKLWLHARDTVRILLFLLPGETWPLLELCYLYEQEAENALSEHRFAACNEAWNLAALGYRQLSERDDADAKCYFQVGYYYLQCWNYPAAYQAFVSAQQLMLSPEHPLWGRCHDQLQKIKLFEPPERSRKPRRKSLGEPEEKFGEKLTEKPPEKPLSLRWSRILGSLQRALGAERGTRRNGLEPKDGTDETGQEDQWDSFEDSEDLTGKSLWLRSINELDEMLREQPYSGCLWYIRGLCLLYGSDGVVLRGLPISTVPTVGESGDNDRASGPACRAFLKAKELGWTATPEWLLPYYLGLSLYLEGLYREAERSFMEVLQHDTQHSATLYWLEKLYSDIQDRRSTQYQALLQTLDPEFPDLIQTFI